MPSSHVTAVADILSNYTALANIDFRLKTIEIKPGYFKLVADAIRKGKVKVIVDSSLDGGTFYYDSGEDAFYLDDPGAVTRITAKALIVHEGVHAVNDMYGRSTIDAIDDEFAAYLAQAMYMIENAAASPLFRPAEVGQANYYKTDTVYPFLPLAEQILESAGSITSGNVETYPEYLTLYTGLTKNKRYKDVVGTKSSDYNGFRGMTMPTTYKPAW